MRTPARWVVAAPPKSAQTPPAGSSFQGLYFGSEKMHYYTFHVGDYRRDTAHLSRVEHGIYRDLIDWYYLEEKPIPIETESVLRRLRLVSDADKLALKNVLADFFSHESDGYHHCRIDRDIDHYRINVNKNRENGKKGGRPKAEKTQSVLSGLPVESESKAKQTLTNNHKPITNNQEPRIKKAATVVATPSGVCESVWQDFVKHRKAKKAQVTQTVIEGIHKEAQKAGWTLEQALTECVVRGWQSFKADWVVAKQTFAQQAADVARSTVPAKNNGPDPVLLKIEQDRQKAVPMPEHIRQQIHSVLRKA